jgi:hypothetical protein
MANNTIIDNRVVLKTRSLGPTESPSITQDLKTVLANLVALTTTDHSGLAKESVKILNKYIK